MVNINYTTLIWHFIPLLGEFRSFLQYKIFYNGNLSHFSGRFSIVFRVFNLSPSHNNTKLVEKQCFHNFSHFVKFIIFFKLPPSFNLRSTYCQKSAIISYHGNGNSLFIVNSMELYYLPY